MFFSLFFTKFDSDVVLEEFENNSELKELSEHSRHRSYYQGGWQYRYVFDAKDVYDGFVKHQEFFRQLLQAFGELDSYISVAHLSGNICASAELK